MAPTLVCLSVALTVANAVPSTMRAWYLQDYLGALRFTSTYPVPVPKCGEVLLEVRAASVNPIDYKILAPELHAAFPLHFPTVFGFEGAGVVAAVGANTTGRLQVGDEVYYNAGIEHIGAYADYHAVPEELVAAKPASLSFEAAAALPLVTATSLQALSKLDRLADLRNGTVLILGGSGGTGTVALQLAKHHFGVARIITTTSAEHSHLVRELGADQVIDYHTQNWWEVIPNGTLAAVYDTVGQEGTAQRALWKLRQDGAFATIAHKGASVGMDPNPPVNTAQIYVHMVQDQALADLELIGEMVAAGALTPTVQRVYALEDLEQAWNESAAGHVAGKLAISHAHALQV